MKRMCVWLLCGVWLLLAGCGNGAAMSGPAPTNALYKEENDMSIGSDEIVVLKKALHCEDVEAAIVAESFGYLDLGPIASAEALDSNLSAHVLAVTTENGKTYALYIARNYALEAVIKDDLDGEFVFKVMQ